MLEENGLHWDHTKLPDLKWEKVKYSKLRVEECLLESTVSRVLTDHLRNNSRNLIQNWWSLARTKIKSDQAKARIYLWRYQNFKDQPQKSAINEWPLST